jgi:hypothetical protein
MPDVETIIRCVSEDEEDRVFLQAAFDELWDECSGRYAGLGNAHRDFARERLACCLALISTGLTVDSDEQASAISNRLRQTLCDTDFLIGRSRTLDFSGVE